MRRHIFRLAICESIYLTYALNVTPVIQACLLYRQRIGDSSIRIPEWAKHRGVSLSNEQGGSFGVPVTLQLRLTDSKPSFLPFAASPAFVHESTVRAPLPEKGRLVHGVRVLILIHLHIFAKCSSTVSTTTARSAACDLSR